MKKRKNQALLRAVIAVVIALVLLACTGFGVFRLMAGPETVAQGADLRDGTYVSVDLPYIMDVMGVEKNSGGEVTAYYATAPVGDQFVLIRFPVSEIENVHLLENATDAYLRGDNDKLPFHLTVTGAAHALDEDTSALLAQWFSENTGWMSQSGVISQNYDYETYLCRVMIESGSVAGVPAWAALAAGIAAGVLVLYAAAELIFAGTSQRKGKNV